MLPRGWLHHAGGRWLWIPGELPVPVTRQDLGLTVGEWIGIKQEDGVDITNLDKIVINRIRSGRLTIHNTIVPRDVADRIVADAQAAEHGGDDAVDVVILRAREGRIVTTTVRVSAEGSDRLVGAAFENAVF